LSSRLRFRSLLNSLPAQRRSVIPLLLALSRPPPSPLFPSFFLGSPRARAPLTRAPRSPSPSRLLDDPCARNAMKRSTAPRASVGRLAGLGATGRDLYIALPEAARCASRQTSSKDSLPSRGFRGEEHGRTAERHRQSGEVEGVSGTGRRGTSESVRGRGAARMRKGCAGEVERDRKGPSATRRSMGNSEQTRVATRCIGEETGDDTTRVSPADRHGDVSAQGRTVKGSRAAA
jgi:hypothetical protein